MKKKKYIALFTIVILLFCSSSILAEDDALENLQNQKNEITTQIDNTNEELLQIQNEMTDTLVQVAGLEEKMRGYEDEITELKQKLEEVKQSSTVTEQELATLEAEYNKQKKALDERIIAIYEGGETQYLDVLLNSRSLSDFISYYYAISQLIQYDVSLIESLETQKHEMEVKKILSLLASNIEAMEPMNVTDVKKEIQDGRIDDDSFVLDIDRGDPIFIHDEN